MRHVIMLYPFWGGSEEEPGPFDRYARMGGSFFEMTSLEKADLAVLPAPWELVVQDRVARDLAFQFAEKARQVGKQTVIFFWSDSEEEVPIEDAIIFRTSFRRSRRKTNEFAMPAWHDDYVQKHLSGRLEIRQKRAKPVVGFCGLAAPLRLLFGRRLRSILNWSANLIGPREKNRSRYRPNGLAIRAQALRILSKSPGVKTNFIVRERFLGGAYQPNGKMDLALLQKVRLEFVRNMIESDYIVCARGGGNFSYRLYETLCCGRIPVFIDTDCVLPYDFATDWKKYCVWIDQGELPLIAKKVAEFHSNLSPQGFVSLQRECRTFWDRCLSPEGFFVNFHRHF
jgi:hypothetical protein